MPLAKGETHFSIQQLPHSELFKWLFGTSMLNLIVRDDERGSDSILLSHRSGSPWSFQYPFVTGQIFREVGTVS